MSLYRVLDPQFYRAQAESRARAQRHLRRKALLRWLLSREVRIAIASLMAMLVLLAYSFAGEVRERRRGVEGHAGRGKVAAHAGMSQPTGRALAVRVRAEVACVEDGDIAALLKDPRTVPQAGIKPGRRLFRASEAPRDRALSSPSARGLDFRLLESGRIQPLSPDGVTGPEGRGPAPSGLLRIWGGLLLFVGSLALIDYLLAHARSRERESEGRVSDGWLRRHGGE